VITAGSDVDVSAIQPYADAIIFAWYSGEQGGNAFADLLFGKISPSGHLPVTFYKSINDVPNYEDYSMKSRTYRYFSGVVQYPFGFGLSYTSFTYQAQTPPQKQYKLKDTIAVTINVQNTGKMSGDEVVQAYIQYPNVERMPLKELKGFRRISVARGASQAVTIKIPVADLQKWDMQKHGWKLYPGDYRLVLGNNSQDEKLEYSFAIL
jgi:beta-glucosidase